MYVRARARAGRAARRTPARPDPTHPGRRRLGRLSPGLIARASDQSLAVTPRKRHPVRLSDPAFDGERGPRWGGDSSGARAGPAGRRAGGRGLRREDRQAGVPARASLAALPQVACLSGCGVVNGHSRAGGACVCVRCRPRRRRARLRAGCFAAVEGVSRDVASVARVTCRGMQQPL